MALPRNIILINDTYNANPQSMQVALESLAQAAAARSRGIAVLGDMGELGDAALEAHRATGALVAELGLDHLFALGPSRRAAGRRPRSSAGMAASACTSATTTRRSRRAVRELLQGNDWVLVKGSRSMQMERVVEALAAAVEGR